MGFGYGLGELNTLTWRFQGWDGFTQLAWSLGVKGHESQSLQELEVQGT